MSMMRCEEPGWELVHLADEQRRGLWLRVDEAAQVTELCSGREGDDSYIRLEGKAAIDLADVITTYAYGLEVGRLNRGELTDEEL